MTSSQAHPMNKGSDAELLPVVREDRELWKWLLDADISKCKLIDSLPDDCPELQAIAKHRLMWWDKFQEEKRANVGLMELLAKARALTKVEASSDKERE